MSQASRSKVRARARHREQVARLIGQAGAWCITPPGPVSAAGSMRLAKRETFFDVAAARELGERMVSDGEALALERVPFVGWCMSRGLGPDNRERGAFVSVDDDCQWISHEEWDRRGNPQPAIGFAGEVGIPLRGGFPGKLAREWQRMGGRRNVAHGAELRRMGQRLLDALAGQPSECHGTGHNLRGVLPPLVLSAQLQRRVVDAYQGAAAGGECWTQQLFDTAPVFEHDAGGSYWTGARCADGVSLAMTRTVPRGEHRQPLTGLVAVRLMSALRRAGRELPSVDLRINGRGDDFADLVDSRLPRWRRGELRHAEQRRAAIS